MATELVLHVTDTDFDSRVLQSDLPVLVDFWASWCGPCRAIAPVIEGLAADYRDKVLFAKVDVDSNHGAATRYNVRSIPTLLLFKSGQVVGQIVGSVPRRRLQEMIDRAL